MPAHIERSKTGNCNSTQHPVRGEHRDAGISAFWVSSNEARPLTTRTAPASGSRSSR